MRNLKRVLALALSLATVLGLMVITSSAASAQFPDADKISYTEAVDVMNGLGILVGDENGNFNPTDTLTREQAAKIISYLLIGSEFADQLAGLGTGSFTDVAADRWSAGYIDYCANVGIIAGNGDGTFNPDGKLTGVAFAKMLLVAMGNDAEEKGYVGNNWTTNVAVDAFSAKINISGVSLNAEVSREQAAQMAFSALTSEANGTSTAFVVKNGETIVYKGTDALTALALAQIEGNTLTTSTSYDEGLGAIYGLTKDTATDEFGRVSTTWTNGKSGKDEVVYASIDPTALLTYTTATKVSAVATALGATASNTVTLNVIEDGVAAGTIVANKSGDTAEEDAVASIGGQGTLVEVYKTADKTYDVIVINTYAVELTKDDITAAKAATATADATDASITIEGLTYKTDAFKAGDVVLYTKGVDAKGEAKIVNVVKADYETGYVTATAANYFRVDGNQKYLAANSGLEIGKGQLVISAETANTFYYDSYGNVIAVVEGETADPDTHYTYVIATAAKAATSGEGDNLFETTAGSAAVAQAKVIDLATGEIKVVNLGVVKGTDGKYYYANANGSASKTEVDAAVDAEGLTTYVELDDGSYVLGSAVDGETVTVKKATASIGLGSKLANSSTKLIVVEYETDKNGNITSATVTTATGIANFPANATEYTGAVVIADKSNIVSSITVVKAKEAVATSLPYAVFAGEGETDAKGTKIAFYVGGEKVEYYAADGFEAPEKNAVVQLTVTDGKATTTDVKAAAVEVEVTYVDETFFVADGEVYYFANSYEVVDAGDNFAAATLAKGDVVTVYTNDKDAAEFVLIAK